MIQDGSTIPIPRGTCYLCGRSFSKEEMSKHLDGCLGRETPPRGKAKPRRDNVFHILVEGADLPQYWMHLEAPGTATLEDLDELLRDVWLTCCNHLSAFTIDDESYAVEEAMEAYEKNMNVALGQVLQPGLTFQHEYDFGTTTELALHVVSARERDIYTKDIRVLARNEPPDINCEECGKPATQVCCVCIQDGKGWVCDRCSGKHTCQDEGFLPVLNSPRTGMCGYGREWDEEFDDGELDEQEETDEDLDEEPEI
jgi:hypothetical protein